MTPHDDAEKRWPGQLAHPRSYKQLRQRARELRINQTPAERRLWEHLSYKKRRGFKFRRQHVIGRFIVDFYCPDASLVIELDGEVHQYTQDRDAARQEYLEGVGLTVLRFTNEDVFDRLEGVVFLIDEALGAVSEQGS